MFFLEQIPDPYMFFSEYSWHIRFCPRRGGGGGSVLDGLKKKSTPGDFWNPGAPLSYCLLPHCFPLLDGKVTYIYYIFTGSWSSCFVFSPSFLAFLVAFLVAFLQLSFLDGCLFHTACAKHPHVPVENASCSARGRREFTAPRFSLLSFARICYATNMSGNQVLRGAHNVVIRGGTFMAADTVRNALRCLSSHANQYVSRTDQLQH